MTNTPISGFSAVAAAAGAQELPCNDAGTTKKVTLTQVRALVADPLSNEGDDLGTGAARWLNLFLGSGGKIDFNNGNVTLTHGTKKITVAGGGIILAAPQTAQAPLVFTPGANVETTPTDGALEMDDNCLYACTDAGNRGIVPIEHYIRSDTTRTFTSDTNQQAIWTTPTNGTLTLETGVYEFEALVAMTSMSGTSGNGKFSLIGAGTATMASTLWYAVGNDGTAEQTAFSAGGGWHTINTQTVADIVTAQTATALCFLAKGTFEITVAGTIIPSFAQTTAAAAVVSVGSYFKCSRKGSTSMTSVGQWT